MNEEIAERIEKTLNRNEAQAERFANRTRLSFMVVVTFVVLLNLRASSGYANVVNLSAVGAAYLQGLVVYFALERKAYRPAMKYVTSLFDVTLLCLVLFLYTKAEILSVSLKNPAFLLLFPLITLTVLRYDPMLTAVTGGWATLLYGCLFVYVWRHTGIEGGGYTAELFSPAVTWVGQGTKILILIAFVIVASYLAGHTRSMFHKLVRKEVALLSEKEAIERELELASTVQAALLPRQHVPDYHLQLHGTIMPGRYVGGDYYDFIRLPGSTVLMVVADVAGKGVPAALIMSTVRASVHLFASMHLSLEELIERLNVLLYESTTPDGYVTLFAAEIDAAGNSITYVNAGHPPPILYLNGRVRLLRSGTMPLGLFPALAGLQAAKEEYSPGSILVACTDGIWERSNAAGELFGESGLRQFVLENDAEDCAVFAQGLLERVRVFGANLPMEDDATLAVARFTART